MIVQPAPVEQEQIGLIEGRMPDSKEEWWVSKALYRYKVPFEFQWELFGGRGRAGGLIVDFVVWMPMLRPLLVHGNYWHKGELTGGDKTAIIAIAQYFNVAVENVLILWGSDAQSEEDVFAWVRKNVAN